MGFSVPNMEELPDKMTGKDLVAQEAHEESFDRNFFDSMDYVDRRDKRFHIVSRSFSRKGKNNYDNIKWNK